MRVTCEIGSFDAPEGWVVLNGVGATERAELPDGSAETFRRSLVVSADALPPGMDAARYFEVQQLAIPEVIPTCSVVDAQEATVEGNAWRLVLQIDSTDAPVIAQWMAFLVEGSRVAVITATALDAAPADTETLFDAAIASFDFSAAR